MADHFFGITDTGKVRDNNEDAFLVQEIMNGKFVLGCVIDGVGGYSGGEVAAAIAREAITDQFKGFSDDLTARMKESFVIANERIEAEKLREPKYANMACVLTLALVDIEKNQFYYAHLGDTRLYLLRDNTLVKVSQDHSFVGFLEESGRLTEEAAMQHPKRNEINKALGLGVNISASDDYIETGESPFLPGDMLLICSDGLTDMVNKDDIASILTSQASLDDRAARLVSLANKNGGKDNITAVLIQNNKTTKKLKGTRPVAAAKPRPKKVQVAAPPVPETFVAQNKAPEMNPGFREPDEKSGKGMVRFLAIICLILLCTSLALIWLNLKNHNLKAETAMGVHDTLSTDSRNALEIKLQEAINSVTGDTLVLSAADYPAPIVISDTLLIQKDSLFLKTKGRIVFTADTGYSGPGLLLASACKYISLDSLIFENFQTGITGFNNALNLKNVRFINCRVPVLNSFTFKDNQFINGRILNSSFQRDSLPLTTVR